MQIILIIANANYATIEFFTKYYSEFWTINILLSLILGLTPLETKAEDNALLRILVTLRIVTIVSAGMMLAIPFIMFYIYEITLPGTSKGYLANLNEWLIFQLKTNSIPLVASSVLGSFIRYSWSRYGVKKWSEYKNKMRNNLKLDIPSDVRNEYADSVVKSFVPADHYSTDVVFLGLGADDAPYTIPVKVWYQIHMMIVGPTRCGKGVLIGNIIDQAIRRGDTVIYIDPKADTFLPKIMHQACIASGRGDDFRYLTLHDDGPGGWAPFEGGSDEEAEARLEIAFDLQDTGDPGTDYYKSLEKSKVKPFFERNRGIKDLERALTEDGKKNLKKDKNGKTSEQPNESKIAAKLAVWKRVKALCPDQGQGFSIESTLIENRVVYVQGRLLGEIYKKATKIFIIELIQLGMRLAPKRKRHLTVVVDEVSFLASKELAGALATVLGFRINFVLAYQSQEDLLNLDDVSVNAKYVHRSINTNCQLKAVYGGPDENNAEWISKLSGTQFVQVAKSKKTEVSEFGAEKWQDERMISLQEEPLIHPNKVLQLKPGCCIVLLSGKLAKQTYTAFVPVLNTHSLPNELYKNTGGIYGYLGEIDPMDESQVEVPPSIKLSETTADLDKLIDFAACEGQMPEERPKPIASKIENNLEGPVKSVNEVESTSARKKEECEPSKIRNAVIPDDEKLNENKDADPHKIKFETDRDAEDLAPSQHTPVRRLSDLACEMDN